MKLLVKAIVLLGSTTDEFVPLKLNAEPYLPATHPEGGMFDNVPLASPAESAAIVPVSSSNFQ